MGWRTTGSKGGVERRVSRFRHVRAERREERWKTRGGGRTWDRESVFPQGGLDRTAVRGHDDRDIPCTKEDGKDRRTF